MQPDLQVVLECCYMIVYCRTRNATNYDGYSAEGALLGELDWAEELHKTLGKGALFEPK